MAKTKIALLYERLSRDDELQGESFSIQNQKIMLEDFARRNGFPRFRHFTDDGVSGTRFDRPGFMAMMEEVEDGGVEAIIVKDMSRLGRDYLKVGQVMEILRQRGVRLIAINDNVDTDKGDNDMTPFLNIMYEFYARDTSKKIRSAFKAKGMSGKHLTGTVIYGYLWDEKREHWLVDEEAAAVVRRIFAMTLAGYAQYAKEQEALATEIAELEKAVSNYDQGKKSAEKFIALIDKYQGFENMTNTMLNEFVEKILVHERDRKGSIETTQAVEVYFNFVGKYIPPAFREVELTREEQEAIRKNEELKDKRHQAYLRRKASGWQRQYEERTRPGKKAKIDAQKAAIRQEDMAKGIYAHVAGLPRQEPKRAAIQVRPTL